MVFRCSMCGMGPRSTILLVGIISLIFSAGYVFFTLAGVLAHNCHLNMTTSPEEYGIYLYYLRHSECGPVNLTYLGIRDVPHDFEIIVPDVSAAAERTYIFCIIGLILFGVWFITSFFSLISICTSCIGRCCIAIGIYPYVITLFLVLIYTAVAFVFYLIDFIQSFDLDFVLSLLEIQNKKEVEPFLDRLDEILLVVPPLLMWLVAGIGVLFWFMFLTFAFVMLGVASRLWAENKPAPAYNRAMQQSRTVVPATAPVEMTEDSRVVHPGPTVAAVRYNDPARQPNEPLPYHQLPPSMVDVRRTIEPLKSGHEPVQHLQVSHVPLHDNNHNHLHEHSAPLRPSSNVNPYTDKRFSYMPGNPQPFSYLAGPPPHSSPRSSVNIPEVRSQLPWSYFPPVEEAAMPKRVTSTFTEHKEFPGQEISAPISKPGAIDDRSSDEGKWSGPEYRY
ncbi:AAEL012975-PB [Aedes aegypti]|uniref:AAEL012975-PA n=1 Tax=Aedes aegypti TaxID=7159 RepID=Q0IE92_AEDAE|nr:AAEL012975-PA [Aedes aegypti]EAT34819.1 AAEL012975-PB [Aedes aegypti]